MKRLIIMTLISMFLFGMTGMTHAASISFVQGLSGDSFSGVDNSTSGWSTATNTINLGYSSFNILSDGSTVTGYLGTSLSNISQKGTRGLGLYAGESDEVDYRTVNENLVFNFKTPQVVDSVEVRSLFTSEKADIYYYLNGNNIGESHLNGVETIGNPLGDVLVSPNILVDQIIFKVDNGPNPLSSSFSVAKLNVHSAAPVPVPAAVWLFGSGLLGLFGVRRKIRK